MTKWVYNFGGGTADGRADMKDLLGGKGANLAEMSSLGLPVPPGFTLTTEVCTYFYKPDRRYPDDLEQQVRTGLVTIEKLAGVQFGDAKNPLQIRRAPGRARESQSGSKRGV